MGRSPAMKMTSSRGGTSPREIIMPARIVNMTEIQVIGRMVLIRATDFSNIRVQILVSIKGFL